VNRVEVVAVSDAFREAQIDAAHAWALELDRLPPEVRDVVIRAQVVQQRLDARRVLFGDGW